MGSSSGERPYGFCPLKKVLGKSTNLMATLLITPLKQKFQVATGQVLAPTRRAVWDKLGIPGIMQCFVTAEDP